MDGQNDSGDTVLFGYIYDEREGFGASVSPSLGFNPSLIPTVDLAARIMADHSSAISRTLPPPFREGESESAICSYDDR